ncbi:MAG TPA: phospholipase D-like domain-containing protein, partial [Verrucomicrobiae bacterium]|nr:phospholipase D-like domain-containing protein [Verrucomicrobiae bacterium]
MDLTDLGKLWHYLVAGLTILIAFISSSHAVLYKRDSRATVLWVGFIWLAPLVGGVLYFLLGVNRIRRRAATLRSSAQQRQSQLISGRALPVDFEQTFLPGSDQVVMLARLVGRVVTAPLVGGNTIEPALNGDNAFPQMIEAIQSATKTVTLATYIFDRGKAGRAFVKALAAAVARGVDVRVLIDDTGARYSWPTIMHALSRAKIPVARFLPTLVPIRVMAINMRSHRKILVVDGETAFTGGMNIRDGHLLKNKPRRPVQDLHFKIRGPVVAQLQDVFANDWFFTTREELAGEKWFPPLEAKGEVYARGIADGPDLDLDKLRWTIMGALSCAKSRVRIITPYFLPDQSLIAALNVASLRGVTVDIILPRRNNLPFIQWATSAILWQMLQHGCRVWLTAPPFDHSKLMLVDDSWSLIGSANWDPRSLRLNFELNVESYSKQLSAV